MIEPSEYILPRESEPQREPTPKEQEKYRRNEAAVYALGFRPFGIEW